MVLVVGAHPQNLSLSLLSRRRDKVDALQNVIATDMRMHALEDESCAHDAAASATPR